MSVTTSTLGHVAAGYGVSGFVLWHAALLHSDSVTLLELYPPNIDLHDLIEHDAVLEPTLFANHG
jgi:hypothetical protein